MAAKTCSAHAIGVVMRLPERDWSDGLRRTILRISACFGGHLKQSKTKTPGLQGKASIQIEKKVTDLTNKDDNPEKGTLRDP